ncbi:hypothetical protein VUR80DRAFT_2055 [Thermomyces stellatus]
MAFYAHIPGAFPRAAERAHTFSTHLPLHDFFRVMDGWSVGGGIDHTGAHGPHDPYVGFPFGARGSCRGRAGGSRRSGPHRGQDPQGCRDPAHDPEKRSDPEQAQDPPEVAPETEPEQRSPYGRPGDHGPFPFDASTLHDLFNNHHLGRTLRNWVEQATGAISDSSDSFRPPLDLFESDTEYVLHLALPGAKKEDIGVHWDTEAGKLRVAGVVHRPGDEAFLQGMRSAERRVGMFERTVTLPPGEGGKKDEVDGEGIAAKMEDGLLIVRVPKMERDEWTEVRKVDIE